MTAPTPPEERQFAEHVPACRYSGLDRTHAVGADDCCCPPLQRAESVAGDRPNLGMATTRELLTELAVRFEIPTPRLGAQGHMLLLLQSLPMSVLDYRTVDGDL